MVFINIIIVPVDGQLIEQLVSILQTAGLLDPFHTGLLEQGPVTGGQNRRFHSGIVVFQFAGQPGDKSIRIPPYRIRRITL